MPDTFLSIDLDFFNPFCDGEYADSRRHVWLARRYLDSVARQCRKRGIPLSAVMNHQQMLRHVDQSGATRLINLDTHSDLVSRDVSSFHCGSWTSFVKRRRESTYHWIHAGLVYEGECSSHPIFAGARRPRHTMTDWKRVIRTKVSRMPRISTLLKGVVHASVVLSPAYSYSELEPVFRRWVKKWEVPYTKGVRREHVLAGTERRPA